jgi:hypothetical protein
MSVRQIFGNATYRIPIYQRAYAWATPEIQTLLRDVRDARINNHRSNEEGYTREYYIGSLVVNAIQENGRTIYEVINGQQRLTTLYILLSVVPRLLNPSQLHWADTLQGRLEFEGREKSQEDLHRLARDGVGAIGLLSTDGIGHAAQQIQAAVRQESSENYHLADHNAEAIITSQDLKYLLDHVKIVRTQLPPNTDLNHYFEVMNTRGEQLEKHEILKARMLHKLKEHPDDQEHFARIWDACAQLTRHIQVQFSTKSERDDIFGPQWDQFLPRDGEDLFDILRHARQAASSDKHEPQEAASNSEISGHVRLIDVVQKSVELEESTERDTDEDPGSYSPIIDFPNFLLHILKIKLGEHFTWADHEHDSGATIRLEDKYLLEEFDKALADADATWVRDFGWLLLKVRFLLDSFVIRVHLGIAGDDEENWVIHRAEKYRSRGGQNHLNARATFGASNAYSDDEAQQTAAGRRVLMLQAMFQVTDTRRASKYFLFQILDWLHANEQNSRVQAEHLAGHLEQSAIERLRTFNLDEILHLGTQVPNFIFNFLDYILWLRGTTEHGAPAALVNDEKLVSWIREPARKFSFRYRTSVEHFYPVQPDETQHHRPLDGPEVNHLGNLCIMSRSENSRRNNLIPKAKVAQYKATDQSLKFQIMAEKTRELEREGHEWSTHHIQAHGNQMTDLLKQVARSGFHSAPQDNNHR